MIPSFSNRRWIVHQLLLAKNAIFPHAKKLQNTFSTFHLLDTKKDPTSSKTQQGIEGQGSLSRQKESFIG